MVLGGKSQGPAEVCWDGALAWERGSPPGSGTGTQGSAAPVQAEVTGSTLGFISGKKGKPWERGSMQRTEEC